jgi:hypothetical protein
MPNANAIKKGMQTASSTAAAPRRFVAARRWVRNLANMIHGFLNDHKFF